MPDWQALAARIDRAAARPFEVPVVYTHDPGGPNQSVSSGMRGVFDNEGARVEQSGGPIITTQPQVGLHVADLPHVDAPKKRDTVLIDGDLWAVQDWDHDGPRVGVICWLTKSA